MIILDTNVLSELMRPTPNAAVETFIDTLPTTSIFTTTIVRAEILAGISSMPAGRRRSAVEMLADKLFVERLAGRVLPFDDAAATLYPVIVASRRKLGRPLPGFDGLIAAIARSYGATIATRNVRDFEGCGIEIIDPWAAAN
ncbi:type II toxin-antitoxin system VapC family toxin [Salinarimonas ramus]|uniref:Ribonuclease VapC n=1 Tax=Salinarimonas ramus TaxID=690164 RepID=A0A917Q8K3_9HYPH|nr:type II toxin-antitoxin system VapC family toxin [Salinarimonas ramus]GGK36057.1 ribonuclease VapC [Salinarimonas ramus]